MKNCILFSFFIIFVVNFHLSFGFEDNCLCTPCNSYTLPQVIQQLLDLPHKTCLGKTLAEALSEESEKCNLPDRTLSTIFSQSLWVVEVYYGFQHDFLSISCVFERILNLINSEPKCQIDEHNEALEDFLVLSLGAVQFTMRTSLAVASCPTCFPPPAQPRPVECLSGCSVNTFLEKYGSTIPSYLRPLIQSLNTSLDVKDRTVAVILCALSRGPLNELFYRLLQTPEMLRAMQLKACNIPISECCCRSREEDIKRRSDAVIPIAKRILEELKK